jgi:carbon storage regulator CsrA
MLIISRKKDQKIVIADDIEITILEVGRNRVRFGINAPKHIQIHTRLKTTGSTSELPQGLSAVEDVVDETEHQAFPAVVGFSKRR